MASRRLAHQNEPIEPIQFFGHWSGAAAGLRILEDVEDAPADLVGRDAELNPAVLRGGIEACAEVEGPALTVEMRRGVGVATGVRHGLVVFTQDAGFDDIPRVQVRRI